MSASDEVDNATGEAPAKENVIELLAEKRAAQLADRERYAIAKQMRDEDEMALVGLRLDARKEIILALETEAAVVIEAAATKEAEARLLGIKRAHGSTVATYGEDEKRVEQAVAALGEAITTLNSRSRKLEALKAEAAAVADRFELAVPLLTMVSEPQLNLSASLPTPWHLQARRPSFEACEHNLRERRDYTEIGGTQGYGIIMKAGLRPFRGLTEQEKEVLEGKAEWKPDPVLAQAATEANALGALRVPGGHVARG